MGIVDFTSGSKCSNGGSFGAGAIKDACEKVQQPQEDSLAVPPFPCLLLLLPEILEVRRRLQELQTKDAAEVETGRAASVYGMGDTGSGAHSGSTDLLPNAGRGGWDEAWFPKGSQDWWTAQFLCDHCEDKGLVDVRGSQWLKRLFKENKFSGSWERGLALLEQKDGVLQPTEVSKGSKLKGLQSIEDYSDLSKRRTNSHPVIAWLANDFRKIRCNFLSKRKCCFEASLCISQMCQYTDCTGPIPEEEYIISL